MLFFYKLGLLGYWTIVRLLSPFHKKANLFYQGRKNWRTELTQLFPEPINEIIWFHAASLGEFEQGRPVIEELKKHKPEVKILLTFFSPSGYEIRKNYELADWVIYLPMDTPSNAQFFIETIKPQLVVFIKYEFWYFYLRQLGLNKIPVLMISGIFRENQLFFRPIGKFYRKVLSSFTHFFVQDNQSQTLLKSIGYENATVAGDTRFDRVISIAGLAKKIDIVEKFKGDERLMVLGSTWPSDIAQLSGFIKKYQDRLKFAIAPHNLSEPEIAQLEREFGETIRYSKGDETNLSVSRILIVDNMGMLSSLYRYGEFAFIGGAFRGALHNTLEAAVYGIPVCFGEHVKNQKFAEAIGLIACKGAFTFSTPAELKTKFSLLYESNEAYDRCAKLAGDFVKKNAGATPIAINKMLEILS